MLARHTIVSGLPLVRNSNCPGVQKQTSCALIGTQSSALILHCPLKLPQKLAPYHELFWLSCLNVCYIKPDSSYCIRALSAGDITTPDTHVRFSRSLRVVRARGKIDRLETELNVAQMRILSLVSRQ